MIARTWHGPDYRATPGNRGVYVLQAIRAFAGADIERARYYPEDQGYLVELEPYVTHYEVLMGPETGVA